MSLDVLASKYAFGCSFGPTPPKDLSISLTMPNGDIYVLVNTYMESYDPTYDVRVMDCIDDFKNWFESNTTA